MSINARELEQIVSGLLENGVPPGVVDRVFPGVGLATIKEAQRQVRVKKYGTDDLNDYLEQMNWEIIEDALTTLRTGSAAEKAKIRSTMLGKQMASALKRNPEGQRDQMDKMSKMFATMRGDDG